MEKNRLVNRLFLLLLTVGMGMAIMACSSDDESDNQSDEPVNTIDKDFEKNGYVEGAIIKTETDGKSHDDVYRFFKKELPPTSMTNMKNYFLFGDQPDVCLKVNSYDELRTIYTGSEPLPDIDFDSYTLVVGKKEAHQYSDRLSRQVFYTKDGKHHLDIYFSSEMFFQGFVSVYYWGLYPKLGGEDITVSVIFELISECY